MLKLSIFLVFVMIFTGCASEPQTKQEEAPAVSGARMQSEPQQKQKVTPKKDKYELTAKGGKLNFDSKTYEVKQYDINKDKKADIINVFKKIPNEKKRGEYDLQIFVKMMDLNHDSKVDVWRYFDEKTGEVSKEELDLDFDGKIDRVDYFIGGMVRRSEFDSQFDENPDIIKSYDENGIIIMVESDQNGDGNIDHWEYYTNGVIERIEKDINNDGKPDVFKKAGDVGFTTILNVKDKFEAEGLEMQEKPEDEMKEGEVQEVEVAAEEDSAEEAPAEQAPAAE